ncbi:CNB_1a_G0043780.mRNA.1.CDS.1 [Saccharomyces cerevisiae]|nr:CNB_1a_G0043780.mRNA.1.CDS.1 [Saccharomyces cerevisiae]CAI7437124.1 CNB_1a_G0043780.mRNA.1.CDS.1 [Saccharomyces cerevisiae]
MFEHSTNLTNGNIANHTKLPNRAYGIMEFYLSCSFILWFPWVVLFSVGNLVRRLLLLMDLVRFSKPYTPPSDTVKENAGDVDTQEMEKKYSRV